MLLSHYFHSFHSSSSSTPFRKPKIISSSKLFPLLRPTSLSSSPSPTPVLPEFAQQSEFPDDFRDGPIELPPLPSSSSFDPFNTSNSTPIEVATSVLLTGAISVFLFRSLRRRARRAKEMRYRSSEVKSVKDEALESLKALVSEGPITEGTPPPSPVQAFLGGLAAGAIAIILYKFTVTIEGALNKQALSDTYSVRQMTITIRTIINGMCYLATFLFAANAVGLIFYSGQLAFNSTPGTSSGVKQPVSSDVKDEKLPLSEDASDAITADVGKGKDDDQRKVSDGN